MVWSETGQSLGNFIVYSHFVPVIRMVITAIGCVLISIAFMIKVLRRHKAQYVLLQDFLTLRYFTYVLVTLPIMCWWFSVITMCDFLCFQITATITLFIEGSLIAFRVKRYRYIILYLFLTLLLCGLSPAI